MKKITSLLTLIALFQWLGACAQNQPEDRPPLAADDLWDRLAQERIKPVKPPTPEPQPTTTNPIPAAPSQSLTSSEISLYQQNIVSASNRYQTISATLEEAVQQLKKAENSDREIARQTVQFYLSRLTNLQKTVIQAQNALNSITNSGPENQKYRDQKYGDQARRILPLITRKIAATRNALDTPSTPHKAGEIPPMVVAANPHAAQAGLDMLQAGGSAVDAAIAVQLVLGLVEPQSSGIGGGGFMLHYRAQDRTMIAYDGRETAPAAATPTLFQDIIDQRKGFYEAVIGGRSVGTPGLIAMMKLAHDAHGKLPWAILFAPAIRLADTGFKISPRLHYLISRDRLLPKMAAARAYFFDAQGQPLPVGHRLKNSAYARSLRQIADQGPDAFYTGSLAQTMVDAVQNSTHNPGLLTRADLAAYQPKARSVFCGPYRTWQVCGMPPPSSGGGAVAAILGMVQSFDLPAMTPNSAAAMHLILEAERLAYADRDFYMADSDYTPVPLSLFNDPAYLARRARQINPEKSMGTAEPGPPPAGFDVVYEAGLTPEMPSTTHFVVLDPAGNMVSMTASVENAFGSRLMAGGFFLNNEMTDFSLIPESGGRPVANRIVPGKRPRSSMSPTFVLDQQKRVVMAIGSPGGNNIIGYVAQTIINVLDWGMPIQDAVDQPHFLTRGGPVYLESGTPLDPAKAALEAKGHVVHSRVLNSGLHGITADYTGPRPRYQGGADKRREGVVCAEKP